MAEAAAALSPRAWLLGCVSYLERWDWPGPIAGRGRCPGGGFHTVLSQIEPGEDEVGIGGFAHAQGGLGLGARSGRIAAPS